MQDHYSSLAGSFSWLRYGTKKPPPGGFLLPTTIIYTKPEDNLSHYVDVLRNQEKCAFVAIVAHLGLSQQIHLANLPACEGVDYILGGDTHERVRKPIQAKYAKVVEPGAFGSFVGSLELKIENGIPQEFVLTGAGWGHGVGLCQIGAAVMGEKGYSYKEILKHYLI